MWGTLVMKKIIPALLGIIPLVIGGFFLLQHFNGNSDAMITYIDETNEFTLAYNELMEQEWAIEDDEELIAFTLEVSIPTVEKLLAESKEYGEAIEKEELREIHNILNDALQKRLDADEAWLAGNDFEAEDLFAEVDVLYEEYETSLEKLAKKWAVEIEWEE